MYWHFGSVGDQYLGRFLCGLSINSDEFDKLLPHWIILNPMEDEDIQQGMVIMFGNALLSEQPNFIPVLMQSLACFVHHLDKIYSYMVQHPAHLFHQLKLLYLSNQELLKKN